MEQFCTSYNLKSLIKESKCFKSVDNPSCIDLILINHPKCFQNSGVYETGISDFHKLTFTVLKTYFQKAKSRIIKYRDCKLFDNNDFKDELIRELSSNNILSDDLAWFTNISKMILEKRRKKGMSDITKLRLWTKSCKKQLWIVPGYWIWKEKIEATRYAYKRQRNFCVKLLINTKKEVYNNLNEKYITKNTKYITKCIWKTVKPSFTDETLKDERITLVENKLFQMKAS